MFAVLVVLNIDLKLHMIPIKTKLPRKSANASDKLNRTVGEDEPANKIATVQSAEKDMSASQPFDELPGLQELSPSSQQS